MGAEQGPRGKGHTFESCRVRQESTCRACRDCGGGRGGQYEPAHSFVRGRGTKLHRSCARYDRPGLRHPIEIRLPADMGSRLDARL